MDWLQTAGIAGFLFFFIKGLIWLVVFALIWKGVITREQVVRWKTSILARVQGWFAKR